ncbi:adhesion G protein-coupled receptor E3-like [Dendropsophus ebraccatus]|uniref:adhesion G protein-coupled receptor E3-like n=1 Tax=Dendropsophus ebraccatus TaxID=150705 RepID=UPI00383197F5
MCTCGYRCQCSEYTGSVESLGQLTHLFTDPHTEKRHQPKAGLRILPPEAINFTKCDLSLNQCPANSTCEETNHGDYCACHSTHYNDKDKLTITYPGGECLERCQLGKPFPCSCYAGFITKPNENGLYACTVLVTTASPLLTSSVNTGNTGTYTQPGGYMESGGYTEPGGYTQSGMHTQPVTMSAQPVNDRCQIIKPEQEKCENHNDTDPVCTFLKSMLNIKEDACKRNLSNTVQKVASQIIDLLNQTSLENLDFFALQTVFVAIIENVEISLLASFSTNPKDERIDSDEIEAKMKVSDDDRGKRHYFILRVEDNIMEVPCPVVNSIDGGAMFISYRGLSSRVNGSILAALGDSGQSMREEVISLVVGGAITSSSTDNLDPPVTFKLKHLMPVKPSHTVRCVFWDTENEAWSTRGCITEESQREKSTKCVCTHLSTFAVIMAPTEIQEDTGLRLISIIGLSISLICLFLSFLTFSLCRSLRSAHTSILMVLCGCLFLGQLLLLVGLEQTWNKILCSVIAGSLQFIFLCAFCWMSLESVLLFLTVRNLQAVNYMKSQRSYFPYVCLIGFGIPAIIMVISASLYPDTYGGETHCWLKVSHIWSFLGPVCMFISINFILLVLTFWLLKKTLASLNSNVSTLTHTRLLAFKALSQLFILGCTWIIGLFQFGSDSIVASYIFTICNSLQGVYIFIVHCLLNRQVREEYSRGICSFYSKTSMSDTVLGSVVPTTLKPPPDSNNH